MKNALAVLILFGSLQAGSYKYITFAVNSNFKILAKSDAVVDSNRIADSADFAGILDGPDYRRTLISGKLYYHRRNHGDAGYMRYFTSYYPPVELVQIYNDAMCGNCLLTYTIFGTPTPTSFRGDTLRSNEYALANIRINGGDSLLEADSTFIRTTIAAESSVVALKNKGIIILVYKYLALHEPWPATSNADSLKYLIFVTHETQFQTGIRQVAMPPKPDFDVVQNGETLRFASNVQLDRALIRIYSIDGRCVEEKRLANAGSFTLGFKNKPHGLYFLEISHDTQKVTKCFSFMR